MKTMLLASIALVATMLPALAGTKELPPCDKPEVERTFMRATSQSSVTVSVVLNTGNVRSPDPTEVRFCRYEVLTNRGAMAEVIFEMRWTSETDERYLMQIKGARYL